MSSLEELARRMTNAHADKVNIRTFEDQGVLVCRQALLVSDISEEDWTVVLAFADEFLRTAEATERSFHYIFDVHRCDQFSLQRMHELQRALYDDGKKDILRRRLISSVIVFGNQAIKMLLQFAFEVYPPVRPCRGIHHTSDEQVARETLQFLRDTRDGA